MPIMPVNQIFPSFSNQSERITSIHVTPTTTTLPTTAIGAGATPATVASFTVPRYCDNSIALTVNATIGGTANVSAGDMTCQIYDENSNALGSASSAGNYGSLNVAIPVIAAEIASTFPTFLQGVYGGYPGTGAYSPATGTPYSGISPLLQTETKTVRCTAIVTVAGATFTFNNVDGQVDSQPPSNFIVYSLPAAPYSNYSEGGAGYYARHIKHIVKH